MESLAVGFWGAYFGTAGLMLVAAVMALMASLRRAALTAGVTALLSPLFAAGYLGWLPLGMRPLAHFSVLCAVALTYMLFRSMGLLRDPAIAPRILAGLLGAAGAVVAAGWMLSPQGALGLSALLAACAAVGALVICIRRALRGNRLAITNAVGLCFILVLIVGLSWIALGPAPAPWPVHAVAALAGIGYLATMTTALWMRYSYLLELREVMAHGPSYDPVTRLRSHAETGLMLGDAFARRDGESGTLGVIVVSLGNLYALEQLHGRTAVNHALFLCGSRLRRCVPASAEMGRLSEDGFLVLLREGAGQRNLEWLARQIADALRRPVMLGTRRDTSHLDTADTRWVAEVGVGLMRAAGGSGAASAVARCRAMSRTALSYPSRVAWHDPQAGHIAELPAGPARPPRSGPRQIITGF